MSTTESHCLYESVTKNNFYLIYTHIQQLTQINGLVRPITPKPEDRKRSKLSRKLLPGLLSRLVETNQTRSLLGVPLLFLGFCLVRDTQNLPKIMAYLWL